MQKAFLSFARLNFYWESSKLQQMNTSWLFKNFNHTMLDFWNLIHFYFQVTTNVIIKPRMGIKRHPEKLNEPEIFAHHDFRVHTGHQQSPEVQVLSTQGHWNSRFNKATWFPLKWLLRERLSNRDRIQANLKDLLGSWKVCNENLVELHLSEKSIEPVSTHYPIKLRCFRVHCGQAIVILCFCFPCSCVMSML